MRTLIVSLTTALILAIPASAQAATLTIFPRTTNDGVFSLTPEQIEHFGVPTATHLAFVRLRSLARDTVAIGTEFDSTSVMNTCRTNCDAILAVLNGEHGSITYGGGYLDPLTTATVTNGGSSFYRTVAFLFNGTSNIGFRNGRGTSTFNMGQTAGVLDFVVPSEVPLPAGGWLLLAGLAGALAAGRRRSKRAQAPFLSA